MAIMAAAMLSHLPLAGQNGGEVPFNGIVESVAGEGVPRMTVTLKGSSKRTSTDRHGRFGLVNVPEDGVLVLSRRGEEWEIPLEGRRSLRVVMSDDGVVESEESEDLISLGFAFVKRREYNYSSDMITGEELRRSGTAGSGLGARRACGGAYARERRAVDPRQCRCAAAVSCGRCGGAVARLYKYKRCGVGIGVEGRVDVRHSRRRRRHIGKDTPPITAGAGAGSPIYTYRQ